MRYDQGTPVANPGGVKIDVALQVIWGLSFAVNAAVTGVLWWAVWSRRAQRPFWMALALGWTLNLIGNVIWAAVDILSGESVPTLTWIDAFYLARYALVGAALWCWPDLLPGRRALQTAAVVGLVGMLGWFLVFRPTWSAAGGPWTHILGVAMYPVLDAGLVFLAWARWLRCREAVPREAASSCEATPFLLWALVAYGIANWINLFARTASLAAQPLAAAIGWLAADLLVGWAVPGKKRVQAATDPGSARDDG